MKLLSFLALAVFSLSAEERRGFVIQDQEGNYYLSSLPNVASCCISKQKEALRLVGRVEGYSPYSVVTVRGELSSDSSGAVFVLDTFAEGDR